MGGKVHENNIDWAISLLRTEDAMQLMRYMQWEHQPKINKEHDHGIKEFELFQ